MALKEVGLKKTNKSYLDSGVDVNAADTWVDWISAKTSKTKKPAFGFAGKIVSGIGDYAAVYSGRKSSSWTALTCDGVGTKTLWYTSGFGNPEGLAQDLLAMNVNDLLCVGAEPRLFLDYLAIGNKTLLGPSGFMGRFLTGLQKLCLRNGLCLVGGETAQMPDLYSGSDFDLAGFCVGFLAAEDFLSVEKIKPGDELWAWPSSGPHSNGFTWLRTLFSKEQDSKFISESLMQPTNIYVSDFYRARKLLKGARGSLKAAFHITGSGFLNLIRSQPKKSERKVGFRLRSDFESYWPKWVLKVGERSGASRKDLLSSLNMGWGFCLVVDGKMAKTQKGQNLLKKLRLTPIGVATGNPYVEISPDLRLE